MRDAGDTRALRRWPGRRRRRTAACPSPHVGVDDAARRRAAATPSAVATTEKPAWARSRATASRHIGWSSTTITVGVPSAPIPSHIPARCSALRSRPANSSVPQSISPLRRALTHRIFESAVRDADAVVSDAHRHRIAEIFEQHVRPRVGPGGDATLSSALVAAAHSSVATPASSRTGMAGTLTDTRSDDRRRRDSGISRASG